METQYTYNNKWGDVAALHCVCSLLRDHRQKHVFCPVELGFFLATFAEAHAPEVLQARALTEQIAAAEAAGDAEAVERLTEAKRASKTAAPCIIPAAYYTDLHTADSPYTPTGLLCVDIDRKDNPDISRSEWAQLPAALLASSFGKYCAFIGESRSGWERGGYFVIVPLTGADDFAARFAAVEKWFSESGVKIDAAAKNVNHCRALTLQDNSTRADFVSLPVVNPEAQPYGGKYRPPQPRPKAYTGERATEYERARKACKYIHANGLQIAEDFEDWTRIAFSFAAAFGEAGEALFLDIASTSPKYNAAENVRKYRNALHTSNGRVDLATFWHLAKQAGLHTNEF